jgi:glutamate dehydrogenase
LAKLRVPVGNFNLSKLSKDGYLVKVEEHDVKLPCTSCVYPYRRCITELSLLAGEIVLDGTDFRNGAHLRFKADLFVPCGGRFVNILLAIVLLLPRMAGRRLSTSPTWLLS